MIEPDLHLYESKTLPNTIQQAIKWTGTNDKSYDYYMTTRYGRLSDHHLVKNSLDIHSQSTLYSDIMILTTILLSIIEWIDPKMILASMIEQRFHFMNRPMMELHVFIVTQVLCYNSLLNDDWHRFSYIKSYLKELISRGELLVNGKRKLNQPIVHWFKMILPILSFVLLPYIAIRCEI